MSKIIKLDQTIYQLSQQYPEIVTILHDLGFVEIVKPMMMNTVGRLMTLKAGASLRNIDLEMIKNTLVNQGFIIVEENDE
mgnify:CR=1 FL=1